MKWLFKQPNVIEALIIRLEETENIKKNGTLGETTQVFRQAVDKKHISPEKKVVLFRTGALLILKKISSLASHEQQLIQYDNLFNTWESDSLLTHCLQEGQTELITVLLRCNISDATLKNMIHRAVVNDNLEQLRLLLTSPSIDRKYMKWFALWHAIRCDSEEIKKELFVQRDIDLNRRDDDAGMTLLHQAVNYYKFDEVKRLLAKGVYYNELDNYQNSPRALAQLQCDVYANPATYLNYRRETVYNSNINLAVAKQIAKLLTDVRKLFWYAKHGTAHDLPKVKKLFTSEVLQYKDCNGANLWHKSKENTKTKAICEFIFTQQIAQKKHIMLPKHDSEPILRLHRTKLADSQDSIETTKKRKNRKLSMNRIL